MSKRFNMVLSDEDYARMEALRSRLGLRSWAEVVRAMLADAESAPRPMRGFMATLTPEQKEADLAYRGDDTHPAPTPKLSTKLPVGPPPFTPRLKGLQKERKK